VVAQGTSSEVLQTYHRRLAEKHRPPASTRVVGAATPSCRIEHVRAVAGNGAPRDQYVEGEPFMLEVWLRSKTGLENARLRIGLREAGGRLIGGDSTPGLALAPGEADVVRLHFGQPPLREGSFVIDVAVSSHDSDRELARAEHALELTVYSREPGADGPVRLGGAWELPVPIEQERAEVAKR
jgi:Wzt C-terminal domain